MHTKSQVVSTNFYTYVYFFDIISITKLINIKTWRCITFSTPLPDLALSCLGIPKLSCFPQTKIEKTKIKYSPGATVDIVRNMNISLDAQISFTNKKDSGGYLCPSTSSHHQPPYSFRHMNVCPTELDIFLRTQRRRIVLIVTRRFR